MKLNYPNLSGHTVVIPGGTGSVGEGVVRAYLAAGAHVIVPTRSQESGERFKKILGELGQDENFSMIIGSYDSFEQSNALADRIEKEFGPITDVVDAIGGWWGGKTIWQTPKETWEKMFVNLATSHFTIARTWVKRLPHDGVYHMIIGASGIVPIKGSGIVSMEQAALIMLSNVLREEMNGTRRIYGQILGPINTRNRLHDSRNIDNTDVGYLFTHLSADHTVEPDNFTMITKEDYTAVIHQLFGEELSANHFSDVNSWPSLPTSLEKVAIYKWEEDYKNVRSNYTRKGTPQLVIMAESEEHISKAIQYVGKVRDETHQRIPFSVRSGGHGLTTASVNDGGVILDISQMNKIKLLNETEVMEGRDGLVQIQAGAKWGDVAAALKPYHLVLTSGNFGDTGVGGLATSGGIGYFIRRDGLTIDRIKAVRLATADGNIRWVDHENEPELFWAIRGGSSQVGIAVEFIFEAKKLGDPNDEIKLPVIVQQIRYQTHQLPEFVSKWGDWIRKAPREMTSFLTLSKSGTNTYQIDAINVWADKDQDKARFTLEAALLIEQPQHHQASITSYSNIVPTPHSKHFGQQKLRFRNGLFDRADEELGQAISDTLNNSGALIIELRSLGGYVHDIALEETAWPHRHQEAFVSAWLQPMGEERENQTFRPLRDLSTGNYGAYGSDFSDKAIQLTWPGKTGEKLKKIAEQVDPNGLFDQGLTIRHYPN